MKTAEIHETSRLEARVRTDVYEQIKEAAALEDITLSAFVIAAARRAAEERLEKHELLRLVKEDQMAIANAILRGPRKHTPLFEEAAAMHDKLISESL